MSDGHVCSKCGAKLPADAKPGVCPKCLMHLGFDSVPPTPFSEKAANGETASQMSIQKLTQLFPELEIVNELGRGGMGVVFKARQKNLDRFVALKVLRAEHGNDPSFAERFTREARALAKLNHPAIISVYDFGQRDGFYFLIMEFIEGANLRAIENTNPLQPEQALKIVPQICDALQYAHDEGIVHRDIKPENILIDSRGNLKIADFGLAKMLRTSADDFTLTGTRQVVGTPHYMAPEQMERPGLVDHRADIFSLGVVIYEMLTGELPLGRFALPSEKVSVDVKLDEVVLRTLAKEPELRYQHVSDIKTQVEKITGQPNGGINRPTDSLVRMVRSTGKAMLILAAIDFFIAFCFFIACFEDDDFFVGVVLHLIAGSIILAGGLNLRSLNSYVAAFLTAIVCLLPLHVGVIMGLPLGIWIFTLLGRSDVRQLFKRNHKDLATQFSLADEIVRERAAEAMASVTEAGRRMTPPVIGFGRRLTAWLFGLIGSPFRFPWRKILGIFAVCVVWTIVASVVSYFVSLQVWDNAPSQYYVQDYSSRLVPKSEAYNSIRIHSSGSGTAMGKYPPIRQLKRNNIIFFLVTNHSRNENRLHIRLQDDQPIIASSNSRMGSHYWPYFDHERTIEEWMQGLGIETDQVSVQSEIDALNRLVSLISIDGGIDESQRPRIRPVMELVGMENFNIREDPYRQMPHASVSVYPQSWVVIAFFASTTIVIILGNVVVIWAVLVVLRSRKNDEIEEIEEVESEFV